MASSPCRASPARLSGGVFRLPHRFCLRRGRIRTDEELSLVCESAKAPADALAREDGWRALEDAGCEIAS